MATDAPTFSGASTGPAPAAVTCTDPSREVTVAVVEQTVRFDPAPGADRDGAAPVKLSQQGTLGPYARIDLRISGLLQQPGGLGADTDLDAERALPGGRREDSRVEHLVHLGHQAEPVQARRREYDRVKTAPGGAAVQRRSAQHVSYVLAGTGCGQQKRAFVHSSGEVLERVHDHVGFPATRASS